jgi:hypothetical protein
MIVNGCGIADVIHELSEKEVLGENTPSFSNIMIHIDCLRMKA